MDDLKISEASLLGTFVVIITMVGAVIFRTRQLNAEGQIDQQRFLQNRQNDAESVLRRPQGGTRKKRNRSRKKY